LCVCICMLMCLCVCPGVCMCVRACVFVLSRILIHMYKHVDMHNVENSQKLIYMEYIIYVYILTSIIIFSHLYVHINTTICLQHHIHHTHSTLATPVDVLVFCVFCVYIYRFICICMCLQSQLLLSESSECFTLYATLLN